MIVEPTRLPEVCLIRPKVFGDERGWFMESWHAQRYSEQGIGPQFVQANQSHSARGVLRGLHYQWPEPQGKLVWVTQGRVLDVAVDIRQSSPTFAQWVAVELDSDSHTQLWVPEGFAHGFVVLSETATFSYLCTRPYRAEFDRGIAWNDPDLAIDWPSIQPELSAKDQGAMRLSEISADLLPP